MPIPSGAILIWSGSLLAVPAGYAVCNGLNGTPDLRDRFVVGAGGSTYLPHDTGGAVTALGESLHTHTRTMVVQPGQSHGHWSDYYDTDETLPTNDEFGTKYTPTEQTSVGHNHDHRVRIRFSAHPGGTEHTHTVPTWPYVAPPSATISLLPDYYALFYIMRL